MSNDTKFWMVCGLVVLCILIDLWIIGQMITAGMQAGGAAITSRVGLWFVLLIVATIVSIPVGILYWRTSAGRWKSVAHKTQAEIEVETLAAYAKQQQTQQIKANDKQQPKQ
jgi:type VI protein secretion system component VasK